MSRVSFAFFTHTIFHQKRHQKIFFKESHTHSHTHISKRCFLVGSTKYELLLLAKTKYISIYMQRVDFECLPTNLKSLFFSYFFSLCLRKVRSGPPSICHPTFPMSKVSLPTENFFICDILPLPPKPPKNM